MKRIFVRIAKICTVTFGLLFIALTLGEKIMLENATLMNNAFHQPSQYIVEKEDEAETDKEYYKSSFQSVEEVIENSKAVSQEVVEEGATLLKNENNALPLSLGSKISLFSVSSISTAYGGGGSSQTSASVVPLNEAFNDVGIEINEPLWNWYTANKDTYLRTKVGGIGIKYSIKDAPWNEIPDDVKNVEVDAAVFVLTRLGTENEDLTVNTGDKTDMTNGSYLMLSPNEITVLKGLKTLKDQGTFSKIIVLLNSPNQVETNFIDNPEYGIDAMLWCGSFGTMGPRAVANIFVGAVNPSGRLSDIYWEEHRFNPVMANFLTMGADNASQNAYYYEGVASTGETLDEVRYYGGGVKGCPYVVYQEGIYNGYRYAETRYEDYVLERENVGDFIYADTITYPFGYGLSYTTFEYSNFQATYNAEKDVFEVSVKVTNTGDYPGKETVQIYLQKPYTDYDIQFHIEKSSVDLVGFAKTDVLAKNASEIVKIDVDKEYFASYDSYGEKTYVVDEGNYFLTAAKDSHDAVNNILKYKKVNSLATVDETRMSALPNESGDAGDKLVVLHNEDAFDAVTYSTTDDPIKSGYKKASDGETKITNQFDTADLNIYEKAGEENKVTYISRNNWAGTVVFGLDENNNYLNNYVHLKWNEGMEHDHFEVDFNNEKVLIDTVGYPTMGSTATAWQLIDMMKAADGSRVEYSNEIWDQLLDQLTWDDMVKLLSAAFRHTEAVGSISKPHTIDHNGAVGVNQPFSVGANGLATRLNDPNKNKVPPAYPCNGIVASTFNVELVKEYGRAWGEDGLWAGYAGLFGPGINGHRAPYAGRIFEYYSEDPILAGKICAPLCSGMKEKGIYVYLKHACLNEQETKRTTLATWANEQTIRENYLRAFEIAIEEGHAECVMLGLNKIGPFETALSNLCNNVLRNEFGMTGHVITDYITDAKRLMMPYAHTVGTDLPDRDFNAYDYYGPYRTNHGKIAWGMREAVHHVLYTVVHSAAMNGMSSTTVIYNVTPQWQIMMNTGVNICLLFFIISLLLLISLYAFPLIPDTVLRFTRGKEKDKSDLASINDVNARSYFVKKDKWYAHAARGAIGAVGLIVLIAQLTTMGTRLSQTDAIIKLATATDDGYINETAGGDNVKSHFFEAESAVFEGVSCYGEDEGPKEVNTGVSYAFGNFHGGVALTNIYTPSSYQELNTLSFNFTSNKKVRCKMRISLSTFYNVGSKKPGTRNLTDYYDIEVNGKELVNTMEISKDKILDTVNAHNNVYPMTYVDLTVKLEEGDNTIKFSVRNGLGAYASPVALDCIDIRTSADLTNYVDAYWDMSGVTLTNSPSYTTQGIITSGGIAQAIPSLQDGYYKEVYEMEETDEYRKYTLGKMDYEVYSIYKNEHTLTIKSPYATFEDESRQVTLKATDTLPEGIVHVSPVGMTYQGWTNYLKPNETFNEENFMMLDEDMEIAPYYEVNEMVSKVEPEIPDDTFKKMNTMLNGDYNINTSTAAATYGFDNKKLLSKLKSSVVINEDDVAEVATLYNYESVPAVGSKFAIHNEIPLKKASTIKYIVQNHGLETLNLDFARTRSSGDAFNASNPQINFTLEPGERKIFTLTQTQTHNTVITGVRINNVTASEFKLAVIQQICYGDHGGGEEGDIFVRLKGGVTFEDGSTYKMLAEGSRLPGYVLTGEALEKESRFVGFKDNYGNIYGKDNVIIGSEDTTFYPLFAQETVRNGYGKLLLGSGNQGGDVFTREGGFINPYYASATKTGNCMIGEEYALTMKFTKRATASTDPTGTDSAFRMLTGYTCEDGKTKYTFTFRNDGDKTLSFSVYNRTSSADTSAVSDAIEFNLAPGEVDTKSFIRNYTANNNVITHFKFNDDNYDGQSLSMYCYAGSDGTKAQVNLSEATFADGATSAIVSIGGSLPTIETVGVVGVKDDNGDCYTLAEYKVPDQDVVNLTALYDTSGEEGTCKLDLVSSTSIDVYGVNTGFASPRDTYIGEERAAIVQFTGTATGTDNTGTGASFRFRVTYDSGTGKKTTNLIYTFKNLGTETLTFDAYQRASGSDTSTATYYRVSIAPGEVATVNIAWNSKINSNELTYIKFADNNWQGQKMAVSAYAYAS